jgi:hypothetical protein
MRACGRTPSTRPRSSRRCARTRPSATTRATSAASTTSTPPPSSSASSAPPHRGHAPPRRRGAGARACSTRARSTRPPAGSSRGAPQRRPPPRAPRRLRAREELADELTRALDASVARWGVAADTSLRRRAARYLVEELGAERPASCSPARPMALREAFWKQLQEDGARSSSFEDDLRALEAHPAERLALATRWLEGFAAGTPHAVAVAECAASLVADRRLEREPAAAVLEARVEGLLGPPRARPRAGDDAAARRLPRADRRLPRRARARGGARTARRARRRRSASGGGCGSTSSPRRCSRASCATAHRRGVPAAHGRQPRQAARRRSARASAPTSWASSSSCRRRATARRR